MDFIHRLGFSRHLSIYTILVFINTFDLLVHWNPDRLKIQKSVILFYFSKSIFLSLKLTAGFFQQSLIRLVPHVQKMFIG